MPRGEAIRVEKDQQGNFLVGFGEVYKSLGDCSVAELKSLRTAGKNRETKGNKDEGEIMRLLAYAELKWRKEGVRAF